MTQVLPHDYGKGRFSLEEIRAAINAVKAEKLSSKDGAAKSTDKSKNGTVRRSK